MNELTCQQTDLLKADVARWLRSENPSPLPLVRWLQGFGLPSDSYGVKPYEWLLQNMYNKEWPDWRCRAARTIARLLDEGADEGRFAPGLEDHVEFAELLLENLYDFAAALSVSEVLWRSLFEVFNRHNKNPGALMRPLEVKVAFRRSLSRNQKGSQLKEIWLSLIKRKPVLALAGDEIAGLDGLLFMPGAEDFSGPDFEAIAQGFRELALTYESDTKDRRRLFVAAVDRAQLVLPTLTDEQLLLLASIASWPDWAIECLPCATIVASDEKHKGYCLVWARVAELLLSHGLASEPQSSDPPGLPSLRFVQVQPESLTEAVSLILKFEKMRRESRNCPDHEFESHWYHTVSELMAETPFQSWIRNERDESLHRVLEPV